MNLPPIGFWSALRFLTRLPALGRAFHIDQGLVWFPIVGVLLGGVLVLLDLALSGLHVPTLLRSTVLIVALLGVTGALHADGLMDTCDAVFAHATAERRLEIMRDPHVGAFGVVGLVCIVALKIAALDAVPSERRLSVLLLMPMLGRWSIVLLATLFPYGRPVGLGLGLKATAGPRALALASLVPAVACAWAWPVGVVMAVVAAICASLLGVWLMRLLPGLTGDCYGAGCELTEAMVLVAAATLAVRPNFYALG